MVHGLPVAANAVETAQALCDALCTIPHIDFAEVDGFDANHQIVPVARVAPSGYTFAGGVPGEAARRFDERAALEAFATYWQGSDQDGARGRAYSAMGLKGLAYGPIRRGKEVAGILVFGSKDPTFARVLVERFPAVVDFTPTPSALLARRLEEWGERRETHRLLVECLEKHDFHPVYQPVVDLTTDEIVGFEALTRFDSGRRPDHVFADARRVGLGLPLERATLEMAVSLAAKLPSGTWLSLNVSPPLLSEPNFLSELISRATRPVVLEITEHEVIEDYARFRDAFRALGASVRLSVDDAGAGIANFAHIVELRPDFIKLDASLVSGVNRDPGRQALVIAMHHFARSSNCQLIAEGIECGDESATLLRLGVEFGQGYFLGRPAPIEQFTTQ